MVWCRAGPWSVSGHGPESSRATSAIGDGLITAFRRFKDVLARWPGELDRYFAFSDERHRGRARAWLAEEGYRVGGTAPGP